MKIKLFPNASSVGIGNVHDRKIGNNKNPFGHRGRQAYGYGKSRYVKNKPRTLEEIAIAMSARELKELCATKARRAIKVLEAIMESDRAPDQARITAAQALIERAFGKATQMNVTAMVESDAKASEIDDKTLSTRIDETIARIERIAGGETKPPQREKRSINVRQLH